jgi:hypothetical protein
MGWSNLVIRKGYSFWQLPSSDRRLLLQALPLIPLVAISLKVLGFQRTQSLLTRLAPKSIAPSPDVDLFPQVRTTARMVRIAVRYNSPWNNCLKQSLVLWWLLRRQGIDSELRIGVKQEQGKLEAHAWVEYDGKVLNDSPDVRSRFTMFDRPIEVKL